MRCRRCGVVIRCNNVNMVHIRYFLAAADQGSYSAAAKACYISTQTMSKAIAMLERELGEPLFERTNKGVKLTEFGSDIYKKAKRASRSFEELEAAGASGSADSIAEDIAIAVSTELYRGSTVEVEELLAFGQRFPNVNLILHQGTRAECMKAVERHLVNLAIVGGKVDAPQLEVREVAQLTCVALMDENHPLADRSEITFDDLRDYPLAAPRGLAESYFRLVRACRQRGFTPHLASVIPSLEAHLSFVRQSLGIMLTLDGEWVRKTYTGCAFRPFLFSGTAAIPLSVVFYSQDANRTLEALITFVARVAQRSGKQRKSG